MGVDQPRQQHGAAVADHRRILPPAGGGGLNRGDHRSVEHDVVGPIQEAVAVEDAHLREDRRHGGHTAPVRSSAARTMDSASMPCSW